MDSNTARIVLDLPKGGSLDDDDIQKAFREKSKEYHPDTSDLPNAREKFLEVKKARKVLLAGDTTQSSASTSATSQTDPSQSNGTNSTTSNNSGSSSNRQSSSTERTESGRTNWRSETSNWSNNRGSSGGWRGNRAGSSTRNQEVNDDGGVNQHTETTTTTDTETTEETTEDGTDIHQRTWKRLCRWDQYHGFDGGGYLGVDEFPERPPSRSRIFHLLAIIIGCIATALLSKGQYNALKNSTGASRVIEPSLSLRVAFGMQALFAILGTFHKAKFILRFLRFPRVFLSVIGGAMIPVIVHSKIMTLSVTEAAAVAVIGSGSMMSILVLIRRITGKQSIPTIDEWADIVPKMSWVPGGVLPLLLLQTPVYISSQAFPTLYYASFKFYFILLVPAIALGVILSYTELMISDKVTPAGTLISMMIIGTIVHLPWFEPIMPGRLLAGTSYYAVSEGIRYRGILITILAISWHFLFVTIIEVLFMGWDVRWHKQSSNQRLLYTVWSTLTGAGIGVAIWAMWPTYQIPIEYHAAHQYLVGGVALFAYTYGIVTEPIAD